MGIIRTSRRIARGGLFASGQPVPYYATNFSTLESPLSEGGRWRNGLAHGLDWTNLIVSTSVATGLPVARGSQVNGASVPPYNDSIACLSGFGANHRAISTVHIEVANITDEPTHEVEALVRWHIGPNVARGYEFLYAFGGAYCGFSRWNGLVNSYTEVAGGGTTHGPLVQGARVRADAIGTVVSGYVDLNDGNGWRLCQTVNIVTEASWLGGPVWTDGNPGCGIWRHGSFATDTALGLMSFEATGL